MSSGRSVESTRFIVTEMSMSSDHDPGVAPKETSIAESTPTVISTNRPPSVLTLPMVVQQGKSQAKIQGAKTLVFSGPIGAANDEFRPTGDTHRPSVGPFPGARYFPHSFLLLTRIATWHATGRD